MCQIQDYSADIRNYPVEKTSKESRLMETKKRGTALPRPNKFEGPEKTLRYIDVVIAAHAIA